MPSPAPWAGGVESPRHAEYATCYGFDIADERERVFAMHVLGLASRGGIMSHSASTPRRERP